MFEQDKSYLHQCLNYLEWSPDPSMKVGAIIVKDNRMISRGVNRFPYGVEDKSERWDNRELKLQLVVHAEMEAILRAARTREISLFGSTLYVAAKHVRTNKISGGPPCIRCTVEILQAGIKEIVAVDADYPDKWRESLELSKTIIAEAGIIYREIRL